MSYASSPAEPVGLPKSTQQKLAKDRQPAHVEEHSKIQESVRKIQNHVADIRAECMKLHTPSYNVNASRTKVQETQQTARSIAMEADALLKKIPVDMTSARADEQLLRTKQQKLTENLRQSVEMLNTASEAYEAAAAVASATIATTASPTANTVAPEPPSPVVGWCAQAQKPLLEDRSAAELMPMRPVPSQQQSMDDVSAAELHIHTVIAEEYAEQVCTLEQDVRMLQRTMVDIAEHAQSQGEVLDNIESNLSNAVDDSAGANDELVQASHTQHRSNKRLWVLLLIVLLLSFILIVLLVATRH